MLVRMVQSVATNFGAYNEGQEYDLAEPQANEFVRLRWAESVDTTPAKPEAAMLATTPSGSSQRRDGRGKPFITR